MLEEEKVVTSQEEVSKEENQVSETTTQEAPSTSQQRRPLKRSIRNRARSNDREKKEFEERVVSINRVSKTVKGGRRMKFSALVVVGDGKGRYGFGTGKAGEVPDAIKKALEAAKKNLHTIHITKTGTLTHKERSRRYWYHCWWSCSCYFRISRSKKRLLKSLWFTCSY